MAKYANVSSVPLSIAVFLATDSYDYDPNPNTISATTLLKPLRQIVLSARVPQESAAIDLLQLLPARMGTAIHDAVERSWTENHANALQALGYPRKAIEQIVVNPNPDALADGQIPVYLEQRAHRQVGKWTVSGKYDVVIDGRVEDVKSTSTFTAMSNVNDERYSWQGSLYRWLNPKIITQPSMAIQFIFTDWSKARALADPKYPQSRHLERVIPLKSVQETDAFVRRKLELIDAHWDTPEDELPHCTDEELWRSEPVFKYYKNPAKTQRSTKNYDSMHDARLRFIEDGSVGLIKEVPGQVTACKYCPAFPICTQKDDLIASGDLVL